MSKPMTGTELLRRTAIAPRIGHAAQRAQSVSGYAPAELGAVPKDPLDHTPYARYVLEAQELRLNEDLDRHLHRPRTLNDLQLALYVAESFSESGLGSFEAVWRVRRGESGMRTPGIAPFLHGTRGADPEPALSQ